MTSNHLLLYRLAELMLLNEQHILPVDVLFDDEQIGDFVKSIQIDSPYQQMLLEGVLTESVRDEKLYVSFTVEGYFHYVLGEVVHDKTQDLHTELVKHLVEENKLNGAKEGVEQCLIRDVKKGDLSRLMRLIDTSKHYLDMCYIPLAQSFLIQKHNAKSEEEIYFNHREKIELIILEFFSDFKNNYLEVLQRTISYLLDQQKLSIVAIIYEVLNELLKPDDLCKAILYLKSIRYISVNERIEKIHEVIDLNLNLDEDSEEVILFYFSVAQILEYVGNNKKAVDFYEKSLSLVSEINHFGKAITIDIYKGLGSVWRKIGDFNKSFHYFNSALEMDLKIYGYHNHSTSRSYYNIGSVLDDKGEYEDALLFLNKALQIDIYLFGNHHPETAAIFNTIGLIHQEKNEFDIALECFSKSLVIYNQTYGEDNADTAMLYNNIGSLRIDQGEYTNAEEYYRKGLNAFLKIFGELHHCVGMSYNNLGILYRDIGELEKAIEYFNLALRVGSSIHENSHPSLATVLDNLGNTLSRKEEYILARDFYQKALEIRIKFLGNSHPDVALSYYNLGQLYSDLGCYEDSINYYENSLLLNTQIFGELHSSIGAILNNLGNCYLELSNRKKALEYFKMSYDVFFNLFVCKILSS